MSSILFDKVLVHTSQADQYTVEELIEAGYSVEVGQTLYHVNFQAFDGDFCCGMGWPTLEQALNSLTSYALKRIKRNNEERDDLNY